MTVGDKETYVLLKTKSLIRRIRQRHQQSLRIVYEHVADLVKWNTFRDWAYRGWSRMPLAVFARLKDVYHLKDKPPTTTQTHWYTTTRTRAAKTMHECHPHKAWLQRAAKAGGEAVKRKYGIAYLTRLSAAAIRSSSKHTHRDDDGTLYRSRLELQIAQLLRKHHITFTYEPEIEGQVPDFQINHTLIEVCGYFRDPDYLTRLRRKLAHLTHAGWRIILVCEPRNMAALTAALNGVPVMAIMTPDEFDHCLRIGKAVASSWRELSS